MVRSALKKSEARAAHRPTFDDALCYVRQSKAEFGDQRVADIILRYLRNPDVQSASAAHAEIRAHSATCAEGFCRFVPAAFKMHPVWLHALQEQWIGSVLRQDDFLYAPRDPVGSPLFL